MHGCHGLHTRYVVYRERALFGRFTVWKRARARPAGPARGGRPQRKKQRQTPLRNRTNEKSPLGRVVLRYAYLERARTMHS